VVPLNNSKIADKIMYGLVNEHDISKINGSQGFLKEGVAIVGLGRADNILPHGNYYMEALTSVEGHADIFW